MVEVNSRSGNLVSSISIDRGVVTRIKKGANGVPRLTVLVVLPTYVPLYHTRVPVQYHTSFATHPPLLSSFALAKPKIGRLLPQYRNLFNKGVKGKKKGKILCLGWWGNVKFCSRQVKRDGNGLDFPIRW